jgi:Baseplate J-like protein
VSTTLRWGDLVVAGRARRQKIRERGRNGVDGVEIRADGHELLVYFLEHTPDGLEHGNIRIDEPPGGRRVHARHVRRERDEDRELQDRLVVELDAPGTTGRYRLRVVERQPDGRPGWAPYHDIDPRYAEAAFVFDVDAPRPPVTSAGPGAAFVDDAISYLGRDFAGLTQLMRNRMAVTIPGWTERHEPDIWSALIELLAYVGDDLSYYQDAVATEAYLQTARLRVSVKRHARLVDYRLDDGCAARAWMCVAVSSPVELPLSTVRFVALGAPAQDGQAPVFDAANVDPLVLAGYQQYSPLPPPAAGATMSLYPAHNAIRLWSWGETDSHLVRGATRAVLIDTAIAPSTLHEVETATPGAEPARALALQIGDVLVLEETADPASGGIAPGDPTLRQPVRVTGIRRLYDELYALPLLEVRWGAQDALQFDLAVTAAGRFCSVASGNTVLVTHGITVVDEPVQLAAATLNQRNVSFSPPFPDPAMVAGQQARALHSLHRAWREELEEWLLAAEGGTLLSAEQLQSITDQFGQEELEAVGLGSGPRGEEGLVRTVLGLAELLARGERLLVDRLRRADVLARLAEASGPLEPVVLQELADDWGRKLYRAVDPNSAGPWGPATSALIQDPGTALPIITLTDPTSGNTWTPALDLIGVDPTDRVLVADVDDNGFASLRINAVPPGTASLDATYRVGNGTAGNAVAEAVSAIVLVDDAASHPPAAGAPGITQLSAVTSVRNPLPVTGGVDAQDTAAAKLAIPGAFRTAQPRALTADDYAALAGALPGVAQAAAELRFSGALTVVEVAVAPTLGDHPSDALLASVERALATTRRIDHVVRVSPARHRPMVIGLDVSLTQDTIRWVIRARLARILSSGWLADGTAAVFNPVNLSFGQTLYASPVIAAVHGVTGVASVTLTRFGFVGDPIPPANATAPDSLALNPLEFARLDNDPADPEHGYALVTLRGGR